MGKKLLFINKYPELVEEFSAAMQGRDVEIDIATNGIEAGLPEEEHISGRSHGLVTGRI